MTPVVVLISGGGSNLEALIHACEDPAYGVTIAAVGADRDCPGLDLAREAGIDTFVVDTADFPDRAAWDDALTRAVAAHGPGLVISAGFLKLTGPRFLREFGGKFVNTHNSLLPAFPGIRGPQEALEYGVKIAGATLFLVDEGVDTGVIIAQTAVPVHEEDTVDTLTERIKVAERAQLVETIGAMARTGWRVEGRRCVLT